MVRASHNADNPRDEKSGTLQIWLFGGFRVSVSIQPVRDDCWRLRKAASLVKLLALAPGHWLHREQVMSLLWPTLDSPSALNNLHHALYVARRVLAPAPGVTPSYLSLRGERLELCPSGQLWVDVEVFEEIAARARRGREPGAYRAALELYAGELLPEDRYEDWAEERRTALRTLYLRLLGEVAGLHEADGDLRAATDALQKIVVHEPAHEAAHAGLMRLYALAGQRYQALRQYEQLEGNLERELGAAPEAASRHLYKEILAGRVPSSKSARRSSRRPDAPEHNLTISLTNFIGREHEISETKHTLGRTRLLTLTGAGGVGKTRLALEVAGDVADAYSDGVWLVELASLSEPQLVPQAVARVLGVREQPNCPIVETLANWLRTRELLLVLDNCEHLAEEAARLIVTLLNSCPGLRILVSSREVLGIAGEVNWVVPPLSVPDPNRPMLLEEASENEAVRLFVDRARYRQPDFKLTEDNARAVGEICSRLDGVPLAVELATARVGVLSVEQISARLNDSLSLLTGGSRTAAPRQQNLRATLDWSHDLLDRPERILFQRLSVFAGGWTLEAAETVAVGGDIERQEVLDLLTRLVYKSLVVAEATEEGTLRYRMLEPVREYSREGLEGDGDVGDIRRRHALFFLALAEEAKPRINGADRDLWRVYLETQHDNLRAALRWAMESEDSRTALGVANAIFWFWFHRSYWKEGRGWLEEALGLPEASAPTAEKAEALAGVGILAWLQGDHDVARSRLEESVALCRDLDYRYGLVHPLHFLSMEMLGRGDTTAARSMAEESVEIAREGGEGFDLAIVLANLGLAAHTQNDYAVARSVLEECIETCREIGDNWLLSLPFRHLGYMELRDGNYERATALFKDGLSALRDVKEKWFVARAVETLAISAAMQNDCLRAARLFGAGETLREAVGASVQEFYRPDYDRGITVAREDLGKEAWEDARAQGRTMTLEEAIEYALSDEEISPTPAHPTSSEAEDIPLSPRELEVALLVAGGSTNGQIARELVISARTVENHVSKVLRKLGFHSRTQVACWVMEHQRLP